MQKRHGANGYHVSLTGHLIVLAFFRNLTIYLIMGHLRGPLGRFTVDDLVPQALIEWHGLDTLIQGKRLNIDDKDVFPGGSYVNSPTRGSPFSWVEPF